MACPVWCSPRSALTFAARIPSKHERVMIAQPPLIQRMYTTTTVLLDYNLQACKRKRGNVKRKGCIRRCYFANPNSEVIFGPRDEGKWHRLHFEGKVLMKSGAGADSSIPQSTVAHINLAPLHSAMHTTSTLFVPIGLGPFRMDEYSRSLPH